jgi:hypothetical protein
MAHQRQALEHPRADLADYGVVRSEIPGAPVELAAHGGDIGVYARGGHGGVGGA